MLVSEVAPVTLVSRPDYGVRILLCPRYIPQGMSWWRQDFQCRWNVDSMTTFDGIGHNLTGYHGSFSLCFFCKYIGWKHTKEEYRKGKRLTNSWLYTGRLIFLHDTVCGSYPDKADCCYTFKCNVEASDVLTNKIIGFVQMKTDINKEAN